MQKRFSTEKLLTVICIAWGLFHLYTAFFGVLTAMWQRSMHRAEHDRGDEADRTECGCRYCELCCGLQLVLS